ncbi:MAG: hypothetical protein IJP71_04365 [Lachnospiraceae bacterium]|nr:hypothetical protein [Lachnospiraceae bacterium]
MISFLLVLMVVVSMITSLVIEVIKKIVSEKSLIKVFKSMEIFSLIFTMVVATITFIVYMILLRIPVNFENVIYGFIFVLSCSCGSQVGYDKVIKTIKEIMTMIGG